MEQKVEGSIAINVDSSLAEERLKVLTELANECKKAFELLGNAVESLGKSIKINEVTIPPITVNVHSASQLDGKELAKSLNKEMAQLARVRAHTNG